MKASISFYITIRETQVFRIVEELLSEITGFSSETEFYRPISCSFFHNIFYFLLLFFRIKILILRLPSYDLQIIHKDRIHLIVFRLQAEITVFLVECFYCSGIIDQSDNFFSIFRSCLLFHKNKVTV